jgi:hypothetical protein
VIAGNSQKELSSQSASVLKRERRKSTRMGPTIDGERNYHSENATKKLVRVVAVRLSKEDAHELTLRCENDARKQGGFGPMKPPASASGGFTANFVD